MILGDAGDAVLAVHDAAEDVGAVIGQADQVIAGVRGDGEVAARAAVVDVHRSRGDGAVATRGRGANCVGDYGWYWVDGHCGNRPDASTRRVPAHRDLGAGGLLGTGRRAQVGDIGRVPKLRLIGADGQCLGCARSALEHIVEHEFVAVEPSQGHSRVLAARCCGAVGCPKRSRLINPGEVGDAGHDAVGHRAAEGDRHRSRLPTWRRAGETVDLRGPSVDGGVTWIRRTIDGLLGLDLVQGDRRTATAGREGNGRYGSISCAAVPGHAHEHQPVGACTGGMADGDGAAAGQRIARERAVQVDVVDHQIDGCRSSAAVAIADVVGETVRAGITGVRCVGDRLVGLDDRCSVERFGDGRHTERIAVHVGVIGQHGDIDRGVLVGRGAVS